MAGSWGHSVVALRDPPDCSTAAEPFPPHPQCARVSVSHILPCCSLFIYFIIAILVGVKWYPIRVKLDCNRQKEKIKCAIQTKGFSFKREVLFALGLEFGRGRALSEAIGGCPISWAAPLPGLHRPTPPCCSPASTTAHIAIKSEGEKGQLGESCVFEIQGDP